MIFCIFRLDFGLGFHTMAVIRVADRFFSGIPHPHLLGDRRPNRLFSRCYP